MQATKRLNSAGQSIWLDNITRELLLTGTLERYIRDLSVTGLTSNPSIFDNALRHGTAYDASLRASARPGISRDELFFELALDDITRAADLFRPIHERTAGVDGWVSLEVSPLLASDAKSTLAEAKDLHARANRPNLFIKIPGTADGLAAIEESIFAGIPINVTLLFSAKQYRAAADAWLRGVERRIEAGLNPQVAIGGLTVRQPLGCGGCGQGARRAQQQARHRRRAGSVQGLFGCCCRARAGGVPSMRARVRSGCCSQAPGRRIRRPPTSCTCKVWSRR